MNRLGNVTALGLSLVLRLVSGLIIGVLLARWLGAADFGLVRFITAVVGVLGFGAHLGLPRLLVREVALSGAEVADGAPGSVAVLSVGTGVAVVAAVAAVDGRSAVVGAAALAALALGLRAVSQVQAAVLQGQRRSDLQLPAVTAGRTVLVGATAALVLGGLGVGGVFAAQVVAAVVTVAMLTRWVSVRPTVDLALVRRSVPYGLNLLFGAIYLQVDVLLLKAIWGDHEVGVYAASALLVLHLPLVAGVVSDAVHPHMAGKAPDQAGAVLSRCLQVLTVLSVPMAVGGMLVAEDLLVGLVGESYRSGFLMLAILLPLVPIRFANNALGMTLTALGHQRARTLAVAMAASLNLAGNAMLIPTYGGEGAALATLATELVLGLWLWLKVRPVAPGARPGLVKLAVPVAAMVALLLVVGGSVWLRIALGGLVYGVVGWAVGAWRIEQLRWLRSL